MTKIKPVSPLQIYQSVIDNFPELKFLNNLSPYQIKKRMTSLFEQKVIPWLLIASNVLISKVKSYSDSVKYKLYKAVPLIPPISSILQYSWVTSHSFTVIGTIGYSIHSLRIDRSNIESGYVWYNLAVYGSIITYFLVTYRHIMLLLAIKKKSMIRCERSDVNLLENEANTSQVDIPLSTILKSENTHLLGISILVSVSTNNLSKILSAFIYSFMNLSSYIIIDLFPNRTLSNALMPLFNYLEDTLLITAATIDYFVIFVYFKECVFERRAYTVIIYSLIYCLRIEGSETCRMAIQKLFSLCYYFLERIECSDSFSKLLKHFEVFILASELPQRPMKHNDDTYAPDEHCVKKRDRIASLVFDSFTVINDLDNE